MSVERSHSGLVRLLGKQVRCNSLPGFKSLPLRQFLHSEKLKDVASAQSTSAWYFFAIFQRKGSKKFKLSLKPNLGR